MNALFSSICFSYGNLTYGFSETTYIAGIIQRSPSANPDSFRLHPHTRLCFYLVLNMFLALCFGDLFRTVHHSYFQDESGPASAGQAEISLKTLSSDSKEQDHQSHKELVAIPLQTDIIHTPNSSEIDSAMVSTNVSLGHQQRQVTFEASDDSIISNPTSERDLASFKDVEAILNKHPDFLTEYILKNVSKQQVQVWQDSLQTSTTTQNVSTPKLSQISSVSCETIVLRFDFIGSENLFQTSANSALVSHARSSRKVSSTTVTGSSVTSNSSTVDSSKPGSGGATPSRKISAHEFNSGELDELPLIDHLSGSFITG